MRAHEVNNSDVSYVPFFFVFSILMPPEIISMWAQVDGLVNNNNQKSCMENTNN